MIETSLCIRNENKTRFELPESSSWARKNKNKTFLIQKRLISVLSAFFEPLNMIRAIQSVFYNHAFMFYMYVILSCKEKSLS